MITTQKLGVWIAITVLSFVFVPQAWAADSVSAKSAAAATSATAVVSASSSAIPAALQKALAQSEGKDRDKAATDAAVEWQKSAPAAALAWVVAQPPSPLTRGLDIAVSQAWAKRDAPAAVACAWGLAKKFVKDPPKTINDGYVISAYHLTLKQWARTDPKAAVAWSEANVPADSLKDITGWTYGSIGGGYTEIDPFACAAWMETLKGEARRSAIGAAANTWWRFGKPDDAAAWIKRLPAADLKIEVVRATFNALYQRDAAKATAWLDSLTIPDEMKADLKKKAEATKPKP